MDVPTLAVWKFSSCDGCQLTLLDCEDELLAIAGQVKIAHFLEASSEIQAGPYDVSLVEGSITTAADVERIHQVREMSRTLVTIGACATAGSVQALRNFADVEEFTSVVYRAGRRPKSSPCGTSIRLGRRAGRRHARVRA